MYATREGRLSFEDDTLQHGIFSHFLVKGLTGDAAGQDGLVTFQDLAVYVTDAMRQYTVKRGTVQIPFQAGESSGDFLISEGMGSNCSWTRTKVISLRKCKFI